MTNENETKSKPVCPRCGSRQVLYRQREPNYWCRACGWEGDEPTWQEQAEQKQAHE